MHAHMQGPNAVLQIPGVLDIMKHFHENKGNNSKQAYPRIICLRRQDEADGGTKLAVIVDAVLKLQFGTTKGTKGREECWVRVLLDLCPPSTSNTERKSQASELYFGGKLPADTDFVLARVGEEVPNAEWLLAVYEQALVRELLFFESVEALLLLVWACQS